MISKLGNFFGREEQYEAVLTRNILACVFSVSLFNASDWRGSSNLVARSRSVRECRNVRSGKVRYKVISGWAISKTGNGEWRNGEWGTGNGERGISKIGNL